jgi:hypothetical protein
MDRLIKYFIFTAVLGLCAFQANAASVILSAPVTTVSVGDIISYTVLLNTDTASINAVDLGILYPGILRVKNISRQKSAIQIWVNDPSYTAQAVILSGGSPGGINSHQAIIATIVFEAVAVGDGQLGLSPSSKVLLNDGAGSEAPLALQTAAIHVTPRQASSASSNFSPTKNIKDTSAPVGFDLVIGKDPKVFNGRYFVSFFTSDSGSGLSHYEIKEGNKPFVLAKSPFQLDDQSLHTVVRVRAYDGAGNYREVVYPNVFKRAWWWITNHFRKS